MSLAIRFRRMLHALRAWLRSVMYEWPETMRVTLTDGGTRDLCRVVRHSIAGEHLVVEDIDGCLYVYRLADLRRYVPLRHHDAGRVMRPIASVV